MQPRPRIYSILEDNSPGTNPPFHSAQILLTKSFPATVHVIHRPPGSSFHVYCALIRSVPQKSGGLNSINKSSRANISVYNSMKSIISALEVSSIGTNEVDV